MIKLFEPFQPKIDPHIDNRFLQSLWDKYVPRTSENYDRISLIYLKGVPGADTKPKQQIDLLVNLVLKNIFMQMNLSQNPMLLNQTSISGSVKHLRKIYLNELKKMDLQLYQSLDQYAVYLERAEKEEIRYREWTKENRIMTQMHREYQVLQEVSRRLEELTSVRSVQLGRKYGKILFRSLDKKEYKILSEAFLWEEKRQVEEYIQNCSEEQYLRIRKFLEKVDSKEQLITLVRSYGQKEFRRFCHKVLFLEAERSKEYHGLLQAGILWKKDKKEIYQQFKQMNAEELHHFWEEIPLLTAKICRMQEEEYVARQEGLKDLQQKGYVVYPEVLPQEGHIVPLKNLPQEQQTMQSGKESRLRYHICRKFSASLEKVQKKYVTEIKEYIQNVVLCPEKQDEYEIIKNTVDVKTVFEEDSVLVYRKSEDKQETGQEAADFSLISDQTAVKLTEDQILRSRIDQMQQVLTDRLEVQEQRIVQREQHILDAYKDIYAELLTEKNLRPEHQLSHRPAKNLVAVDLEETFRQKYGTKRLSETFIQKLKGWSEAILSFSGQGQEKNETEQFRQQIQMSKDKTELKRLVEELTLNMDNVERIVESDPDTRAIQQATQDTSGKAILVYREEQIRNPQIQELLQYLHQLKEEERREFVRQLADMVLIQKQTADRNSILKPMKPKDDLSRSFIEKLESWSSTLLSFTEEGQEKTQTELLQQQIHASEDKAELQRLIVELSRYAEDEEDEGNVESDVDTEAIPSTQVTAGKLHLIYRDEQLRSPQIQGLLQYLRQVKEEERREFIRQLGDMILIQKQTASKNIIWKQTLQKSTFDNRQENMIKGLRENSLRYVDETAIEEVFRLKYEKYHLSTTFIRHLERWGNALLNLTEEGQEKTQTELLRQQIQLSKDKADFQRLTLHLTHYLEESEERSEINVDTKAVRSAQDIPGKTVFVYREEQLQNVKIQELLQYLRQVKEEERQEVIRRLSDMIRIQKQMSDPGSIQNQLPQESLSEREEERMFRDIETKTTEEVFLQKYEKRNLSKTFIKKLERWSQALLNVTEQEQEKSQTDLLRQQIQMSEDKADFQKLAEQLVHYMEEEEENREIYVDPQAGKYVQDMAKKALLVYREEQLRDVKIQELLQHLRQIKEEERPEVVRQLAGMIMIQKQTGRTNEADIQKEADLQDEEKNFSIEDLHTQMAHRQIETGRHRTELRHLIMQMKYPELADRIQVYEEQRKKIREAETGRMKTLYTDIIETVLRSEESKVQEAEQLHRISAYPGRTGHPDIKFVFPEETLSVRTQDNNTEIQKETLQVRSLQQHMDVRLREVERQLQKRADSHPGASDDIRTIAEKVKKQLHEELHMERLRRGLV